MATLDYRLVVYEERATQSNLTTEPDVLSPVGGAVHADPFQVATCMGVSGYQEYLELPEGRTGKLDKLERKTDQGQQTFTIIDKRTVEGGAWTSGSWVSAFLSRLKPGCKVIAQERVDGGSWVDWWTGRIEAVRLEERVALQLRCRDMLGDLARHECFVGRPHSSITYAAEPLLLPLGLSAAFGPQQAATAMGGTINSDGVYRTISLNGTSRGRKDNVVTQALLKAAGIPFAKVPAPQEVRASVNLRVRFTAGAVTQKEGIVVKLEVQRRSRHYQVNKLWIREVNTSDPNYTSLTTGTIANATTVTGLTVRQLSLVESGGEAPLLLDNVTAPQLIADLLDGKFGQLNDDGTVQRSFPRGSSFTALIADTSFPVTRWVIEDPGKVKDWVEANVLKTSGLGWRVNASGAVELIDLRPPVSSPTSTTITEADLVDGTAPDWELNRDQAVNIVRVTTYMDVDRDADELSDAQVPSVPTTLIDSAALTREIQIGDNYDLGTKRLELDCRGFRTFPNEQIQNQDRSQWIDRLSDQLAMQFRAFAQGLIGVTLRCARTSNTDCQVGDWRLIDVDVLPDPTTNLRGGTRLMQCIERTDQPSKGLERRLRFSDAGPNNIAAVPVSIGTPTQESSNTQNGLAVVVTLNASSQPARLWINSTLTSVGSRPADTDAGWRLVTPIGYRSPLITASSSIVVRPVAGGKRHWVALETAPVLGASLGSARIYPAGTGYVDSATLTAPNTAAVGSVSTKAATATWSNNSDDVSAVEIWLASGTSQVNANAATPVRYRVLQPATTSFVLTGLDTTLPELGTVGPWYQLQIKHSDGYGGISSAAAIAGTSFQATGAATTAPAMAGVAVLRSGENSPYVPNPGAGLAIPGGPGIEFQWVVPPTGLGLNLEVERAPDSGGSPGSWAAIDTLSALSTVRTTYRDSTVKPGSGLYWYRGRLIGDGVSAGAYATLTAAVTPGWLTPQAYAGDPGEPVLGVEIPIDLGPADFAMEDKNDDYLRNSNFIRTAASLDAIAIYAKVGIPEGAIISRLEILASGDGAGNAVDAFLEDCDEANTVTTLATVGVGNTSGVLTTDSDSAGATIAGARHRFAVHALLTSGATGNGLLARATVWYIPTSYQQVRGS